MTPAPHLVELVLEVTNACHHRCVHCSTYGGTAVEGELCQEERVSVLREACELGLEELRLLGGDPLVSLSDTAELLAEANRLDVARALIYTSAVERKLEWLKTFAALRPIRVSAEASIYSASPLIHDQITQKAGSLERVLANSREAVRVGFDLNWNFVWMKANFGALESVVALAWAIGIKRVRVLRLMLNGRARDNRAALQIPVEWERRCESILLDVGERFPGVLLAHSKPLEFQLAKDSRDRRASCSAGRGQLVVEANGTVLPCVGMKGMREFTIGNVRTATLAEMFSRSRRMYFDQISRDFQECPAILYQLTPQLVQLTEV
jgi:MoaA/NifB/PqqE/SkfB family radical SAM enzyme